VRSHGAAQDDDPDRLRALGVIDLPTIQRYLNFHFSVTIDLFGATCRRTPQRFIRAVSRDVTKKRSTAMTTFCGTLCIVLQVIDGRLATSEAPALNALNEKLRDDYIKDSVAASDAGTASSARPVSLRIDCAAQGIQSEDRTAGGLKFAPDGRIVSEAEWARSSATGSQPMRIGFRRLVDGRVAAPALTPIGYRRRLSPSTSSPPISNLCGSTRHALPVDKRLPPQARRPF